MSATPIKEMRPVFKLWEKVLFAMALAVEAGSIKVDLHVLRPSTETASFGFE